MSLCPDNTISQLMLSNFRTPQAKMSWSMLCTELQVLVLEEILLPSKLVMRPIAHSYERALLPAKSLNVLQVSRGVQALGLSIFHRNVFTLVETSCYDDSFTNLSRSDFREEFVSACEHSVKQVGSLMTLILTGDHVLGRPTPQTQRHHLHEP